MTRALNLVVRFAFAAVLPVSTLQAAELTGGTLAKFVNKAGTANDRAIVKFTNEAGIVARLPDPTLSSSTIRFLSDTGETGVITLNQSKWTAARDGFLYKDESGSAGGVLKVTFKTGKLIVAAKGDGYGVTALAGPVAFVQVEFTVGLVTYTGRFVSPPAQLKSNTSEKVLYKGKAVSIPAPTPTPTASPIAFPDPCAGITTPCESLALGSLVIFSWQNGNSISTVANDGNGEAVSLEWIPAGDLVDLVVTFPGLRPLNALQLEGAPLSLQRANIVTGVILGLNAEPAAVSSATALAGIPLPPTYDDRPGNKAGCDSDAWPLTCFDPPVFGPHGACCDDHDACIDVSCKGPKPDSGDARDCWLAKDQNSTCVHLCLVNRPLDYTGCQQDCDGESIPGQPWSGYPACSPECQKCHDVVAECFWGPATGKAQCCSDGDCFKLQQCIINDKVITVPCVCQAAGKPTVDPCLDPTTTPSPTPITPSPTPLTPSPTLLATDTPVATPISTPSLACSCPCSRCTCIGICPWNGVSTPQTCMSVVNIVIDVPPGTVDCDAPCIVDCSSRCEAAGYAYQSGGCQPVPNEFTCNVGCR